MEYDKELLLNYIKEQLREGPILARENIYQNGKKLKYRSAFLKLKQHADNFLRGNIYNRFIVMPGLRGVGKTTLIFQLYDYLMNKKGIEANRILYVSTDQLTELLNERLHHAIDVFIRDVHKKTPITLDKELFIFVDEAQYDEKWSQTGKMLYDQSKKIFMIFSGSSALQLELNVDAIRRTKKEPLFPLNFQEYLLLKHGIYPPKSTSKSIRKMIINGEIMEASEKELELINKLSTLRSPPEKEWEDYLCYGGFPISIHLNEFDIHRKTYEMIQRIIEKDINHYRSFRKDTTRVIFRILTFLALQKPGELSEAKLASKLDVSSSLVNSILDILEKTHLIFHVDPHGTAGKAVRKPRKYYFLSPSIKASLNFILGRYAPEKNEFLGPLAENLVASSFFKMKEIGILNGILYPADPGSVDFLLSRADGEIIPVEVGVGRKSKGQLKKAIKRYKSNYGILVSNRSQIIEKEGNMIQIPLTTFSFI
ncbi:ATP-binding protein [Methanothermobacter wolfeii]|uniref:ATP-binding protein n=1 Tax=Methanothermobacter wolfeii TaxID=145261 RepID=UPI0024B3406E|nr:AAA family ATPase [Methanothermobacter wolfeii]MDI6701719.1 AAA family ATPase [Methanothermobacter wolfeii]MDI6842538.1 AAA family ATPase [Methanothermobacter wolfeii]